MVSKFQSSDLCQTFIKLFVYFLSSTITPSLSLTILLHILAISSSELQQVVLNRVVDFLYKDITSLDVLESNAPVGSSANKTLGFEPLP